MDSQAKLFKIRTNANDGKKLLIPGFLSNLIGSFMPLTDLLIYFKGMHVHKLSIDLTIHTEVSIFPYPNFKATPVIPYTHGNYE